MYFIDKKVKTKNTPTFSDNTKATPVAAEKTFTFLHGIASVLDGGSRFNSLLKSYYL